MFSGWLFIEIPSSMKVVRFSSIQRGKDKVRFVADFNAENSLDFLFVHVIIHRKRERKKLITKHENGVSFENRKDQIIDAHMFVRRKRRESQK